MQVKEIAATFFSMFPGNADIRRAFEALRQARNDDGHIVICGQ